MKDRNGKTLRIGDVCVASPYAFGHRLDRAGDVVEVLCVKERVFGDIIISNVECRCNSPEPEDDSTGNFILFFIPLELEIIGDVR